MTLIGRYDLAEKEQIEVEAFALEKREALSVMDSDGQCCIAMDPRRIASAADEKTKLAHELGHCITGAFYSIDSPFDIRQRHENRADKWAIKRLVPEKELEKAVADGYTEIWALADFFGVTEDLMRRAVSWYKFGNLES